MLLTLTKRHLYLRNQYYMGKLNLVKVARRLGYRGASLTKGIAKVKRLLSEMGISLA